MHDSDIDHHKQISRIKLKNIKVILIQKNFFMKYKQ